MPNYNHPRKRCKLFACVQCHTRDWCCHECPKKKACPNPCLNHPGKCRPLLPDGYESLLYTLRLGVQDQTNEITEEVST